MLRPRINGLAAGVVGMLLTAGCQHHKHRSECCPCSCEATAKPSVVVPANEPIAAPVTKPVPAEPAVRSTIINSSMRMQ
ncbi:MAG TPA: hypothetical protein VH120_06500 [Gemmataceae bacterium]|jgi:hypothetical protein|nr:hypothetical protein [Gemmataceae bacterium]